MRIEVFTDGRGYTVIVNDRFSDCLCADEALGVIAAALFGEMGTTHPFLHTLDVWVAEQKRMGLSATPHPRVEEILGPTDCQFRDRAVSP